MRDSKTFSGSFSGSPSGDRAAMVRQMEWWFRGGADSEIVERRITVDGLGDPMTGAESKSRLALIIVR
jgi:hypothetical protein